jgi:hypothetical protein
VFRSVIDLHIRLIVNHENEKAHAHPPDLLADVAARGSDAFQAGGYSVSWLGPAYVAGALAFSNHWFTTNRSALGDALTANFTGQSYGARLEGGYRYARDKTGYSLGVPWALERLDHGLTGVTNGTPAWRVTRNAPM